MTASSADLRPVPLVRTFAIVAVAALVGALTGGAIGLALSNRRDSDATAGTLQPAVTPVAGAPARTAPTLSPEAIYRAASPGVVVITDTQVQPVPATPFTPSGRRQVSALGSGFVVDERGDILTNDHVVSGATNIRVGFGSAATYPARIVGTDPSTDLAVVRVRAPVELLHPLGFGDSSRIQVGDSVYAIGNPFGLDRTMTAGIVSATGRTIRAPNGLTIPETIQTDAPINHGNSGGPLLDDAGRVIGVNAQIEGGTVDANVGIGFAIPSDTARSVGRQLIATGSAQHAWLGVQIETIDPSVARVARGLPSTGVSVVAVVPGSPAAKAGLVPARQEATASGASEPVGGDSIVGIDGRRVTSSVELTGIVARHRPGDTVALQVFRDGATRTVRVTLADAPG